MRCIPENQKTVTLAEYSRAPAQGQNGVARALKNPMKLLLTFAALLFAFLNELPAVERAQFIVPPEVFIHHTPERSFIGPGMLVLENGDILMVAPWGRPPTNFEQIAAKFPVPMLYRSTDGGRTWKEQGRMQMEWNLAGLISDGGTSFLRLPDGRIAVVFNRHVKGLHGGGTAGGCKRRSTGCLAASNAIPPARPHEG
jgi:hypothetical protein